MVSCPLDVWKVCWVVYVCLIAFVAKFDVGYSVDVLQRVAISLKNYFNIL